MFFERGVREDGARPAGSSALKLAIIGAGPSGLVTAIALMKRLHRPFEAWLIDAEDAPGAFGNGVAGTVPTTEPARDLSVVPERPDDFADWLKAGWLAGGTIATLRRPQDLHAPRSLFRDYVMARFGEALSARKDVRIRTFRGHVRHVGTDGTGPYLCFRDGEQVAFDHVFVATGFGTAQREAGSWQGAQSAAIRLSELADPPPLTLVGNGPRLAAILLHLRAGGYAGEIHIAAASGRLPQPHVRSHAGIVFSEPPAGRSLREAFGYVRHESLAAEARTGGQWQAVVDAASARLSVVWRNLPQTERNRYRRHLLRLHRHFSIRLAPDVHRRLAAEIETGRTHFVSPRSLKLADENTIDCREAPSARALAGLLACNADRLAIDDGGWLTHRGLPVPALSVVGAVASSLRPGPFTFAETVRQAYRAVLAATPQDLARTFRP